MDAMLPNIRPIKESTISREEISIRHSMGVVFYDQSGEIVLQRESEPIMHIDLDSDEQKPAHLEDRDSIHIYLMRPLSSGHRATLRGRSCEAQERMRRRE